MSRKHSNTNTADTPAAYKYDAFISYKHNPLDSAAAAALQKNLEHFHTPSPAGMLFSSLPFPGKHKDENKEKKIRRIFLDNEEMTAGGKLSDSLEEALRKSEWLIVICSLSIKESIWVPLEIESFLETHDRDHIMTVMIEGEPDENTPEILYDPDHLENDYRAADARGRSKREILKKLKGRALLEIAAPILGMSLYELTQRHRVYIFKQITAAAVICLAALTGFLLYAFSQNRILEKANNNLFLRQAELVTKEASELLEEGENLQAVRNLLSVLPDPSDTGRTDRPDDLLLPETQYLLTKALNLYMPSLTDDYRYSDLAACAVLHPDEILKNNLLSDGIYLLAASDNKVFVWDITTDLPVTEFSFVDSIKNWSKDALLSENRIILCGSHIAACYNYVTGEQLWKTAILNEVCAFCRPVRTAEQDREMDCMYILTNAGIDILRTEDGTILSAQKYDLLFDEEDTAKTGEAAHKDNPEDEQSNDFPEDDPETWEEQNIEAGLQVREIQRALPSSSGKYIIFSAVSSDDSNQVGHLYICVPETGQTLQIDPEGYDSFHDMCTTTSEDGKTDFIYYVTSEPNEGAGEIYSLKAVSLRIPDSASDDAAPGESGKTSPFSSSAEFSLSDAVECKIEWESSDYESAALQSMEDTTFIFSIAEGPVLVRSGFAESGTPALYFGCHSHIFIIDPSDGHILHETALPAEITGLLTEENHCLAYTTQGNIYSYNGEKMSRIANSFPRACRDIEKIKGNPFFYCLKDSERIIKYAPMVPDDNYTLLKGESESSYMTPLFRNQNWLVWEESYDGYRWISLENNTLRSVSNADIIKNISSLGPDFAELSESDLFPNPMALYLEDNFLHLYNNISLYDENHSGESLIFHHILDLSDGSISTEPVFIADITINLTNLLFDPGSRTLYFLSNQEEYMVLWSCDPDGNDKKRELIPLPNISAGYLSPDGEKILLLSQKDLKLYILDLDTLQTETNISLSGYIRNSIDEILYESDRDNSLICWDGETLAIADYCKIHIYDKTGKETHTISCGESTDSYDEYIYPCMALCPDGDSLYYYQSGTLFRYSFSESRTTNTVILKSNGHFLPGISDNPRFLFAGDGSEIRSERKSPDTLYLLIDNVLYIVHCDDMSFGLTACIENVSDYHPQSGRIYLSIYDPKTRMYRCLYYEECSLNEIIKIAKERYGDDH